MKLAVGVANFYFFNHLSQQLLSDLHFSVQQRSLHLGQDRRHHPHINRDRLLEPQLEPRSNFTCSVFRSVSRCLSRPTRSGKG